MEFFPAIVRHWKGPYILCVHSADAFKFVLSRFKRAAAHVATPLPQDDATYAVMNFGSTNTGKMMRHVYGCLPILMLRVEQNEELQELVTYFGASRILRAHVPEDLKCIGEHPKSAFFLTRAHSVSGKDYDDFVDGIAKTTNPLQHLIAPVPGTPVSVNDIVTGETCGDLHCYEAPRADIVCELCGTRFCCSAHQEYHTCFR
jgi:hypothetical protein